MPSNVQLNTGTGGALAASAQITHDGDTAQLQLIGLMGVAGTEDAYTAAKINGDATNGLDVDVTRVVPGTTASALGKAEDAAHASGDVGVLALAVRRDTAAAGSDVDGDYSTFNVDASGRLHVNVGTSSLPSGAATSANQSTANTALAAIQTAVETLDNAISGTEMQVDVVASLPAGTNNIGDVDVLSLPALPAGTNNIGDVDVLSLPALPAGTNNIGDVDVLTVPADPFGANADAASATGSISAKLRFIAATGIPVTALPASTNTIEVVGDAAHDAAVAGNPVLSGAEARSSDGTAVANGDVVRMIATLLGKQVMYPYAVPGTDWHYAAASGGITNTTGVTARAAQGAGIRNYVTRAEIINGHATVSTDFQIRDGAAGTVLWRGYLQAAGGGVAAVFDPPLRATANTLIEIACGTTGSAVYANLHGFSAAE